VSRIARGPDPRATESRMHMLQHNRGAVLLMLGSAVREGKAGPFAAIVADTLDHVGGDIARAFVEKSDPRAGLDVGAEASKAMAKGQVPTFVCIVPVVLAAAGFAESHPEVSRGLSVPAKPGRLPVVVVGSGGATLVQIPTESSAAPGRA
jgi:hypothetical protein